MPAIASRKTNYGTKRLIKLLQRVGRKVSKRYSKSKILVGNLGNKKGGKIRWSVSHQGGRDADLGFYALDKRGRRVQPTHYVSFGRNGRSRDGRLRFDDKRNLALVKTLLEDDKVQIQYIFVADWLKKRLIKRARRKGLDAELIDRMGQVLHQPSDSSPHDDHYHIRLYCTVPERLHGCLERGPIRPWVDLGDDAYALRVKELLSVLDMEQAELRRKAIDKLRAIRAEAAVLPIVARLEDDDADVRKAALRALKTLAMEEALPGLLDTLAKAKAGSWASDVYATISRIKTEEGVRVAQGLLSSPEDFLSAALRKGDLSQLHLRVITTLRRHGRKEAAYALEPLLTSPNAELRQGAHEALLRITNQKVRGKLDGRSKKGRARVVNAWKSFLKSHHDDSWLHWLRLGFEARGYRFRGRMMRGASGSVLIKAVGNKDDNVSRNAVRVLGELTGHRATYRSSRAKNLRYWRKWWRRHGKKI